MAFFLSLWLATSDDGCQKRRWQCVPMRSAASVAWRRTPLLLVSLPSRLVSSHRCLACGRLFSSLACPSGCVLGSRRQIKDCRARPKKSDWARMLRRTGLPIFLVVISAIQSPKRRHRLACLKEGGGCAKRVEEGGQKGWRARIPVFLALSACREPRKRPDSQREHEAQSVFGVRSACFLFFSFFFSMCLCVARSRRHTGARRQLDETDLRATSFLFLSRLPARRPLGSLSGPVPGPIRRFRGWPQRTLCRPRSAQSCIFFWASTRRVAAPNCGAGRQPHAFLHMCRSGTCPMPPFSIPLCCLFSRETRTANRWRHPL